MDSNVLGGKGVMITVHSGKFQGDNVAVKRVRQIKHGDDYVKGQLFEANNEENVLKELNSGIMINSKNQTFVCKIKPRFQAFGFGTLQRNTRSIISPG